VNSRHIELVNAILQGGSLSAAARVLGMTQPSATRCLQQAERTLGYALFNRRGGRLQPTDEMLQLAPVLRLAFAGLDDARRTALNLRGRQQPSLRVGVALSLAGALPAAYERMVEAHGELRCEFSTGHFETLLQWLLMHEIDVGVALEPPAHAALSFEDLGPRRLVCAARPERLGKYRRARHVDAAALKTMALIEVVASDPVGARVAAYAQRYDWPYPARLAVKTHQIALDLAAHGLGVAVVDDLSASRYAGTLVILPIEPAAHISVQAMTVKTRPVTVAATRFIDCYRAAMQAPG
jgi:DNA-binding transcriptional LysR family regulator